MRLLSIFTCEELKDEYYLSDKDATLDVIEEMYRTWRSLQHFGYMKSDNSTDFGINTLVAFDSASNDLLLVHIVCLKKINGKTNLVYRQVQAGTNACFSIHTLDKVWADEYAALQDIPMIDTVIFKNSNDFASKIK